MTESTPSRALYIPLSRRNLDQDTLKTSYVIEEVLEQKQVVTTPKETPTKEFPLSNELLQQPVQVNFKLPQLSVYFEKKDTEQYIQHFVAIVVLHGWNKVTKCKAFPLSLAGQVQQWFTGLPARHIGLFEQLKKKFLEALFAHIPKKKSTMYLMSL